MPTNITVKNIPDEIYNQLKRDAKLNHRSLNGQVIASLEQVYQPKRRSVEEILAQARELRKAFKGEKITDAEIERDINEGRP